MLVYWGEPNWLNLIFLFCFKKKMRDNIFQWLNSFGSDGTINEKKSLLLGVKGSY